MDNYRNVLFNIYKYYSFGEVLHHRLDTSFSTMKGSGVIEPRFERVWPEALMH